MMYMTDSFQNVMILLEQCAKMQNEKDALINKLNMLPFDSDVVDSLEDEINYLSKYSANLYDQAVVIINENNLVNVPSLETIRSKFQASIV